MRDKAWQVKLSTDTDASGDGTDTAKVAGYAYVHAVKVDFAATTDAGADTTLVDSTGQTVVNLGNTATDVFLYPRVQEVSNAGAGTSTYTRYLVSGVLTLTIAQGGNAVSDAVTVTVFLTTE